jgi:hypothetical protein
MIVLLGALLPWISVLAIALSPLIATQVSERLQRGREDRQRKFWVLQTLMANRHNNFADDRIRALNSVDILFSDNPSVKHARRTLIDALTKPINADGTVPQELQDEWNEALWHLVAAISDALKIPVTRADFFAGYVPRAVNDAQLQQLAAIELNKTMIMYFRAQLGLPWNPHALLTLTVPPAVQPSGVAPTIPPPNGPPQPPSTSSAI